MSSIAIGVAALVSIDSFAGNVTRSAREQSRTLMGGDAQILARRPFSQAVERLLDSLSQHGIPNARLTTFTSMALVTRTQNTRLSQVRAVDGAYPLYGRITTEPSGQYERLQTGAFALADPSFLLATGARIGDTITLGRGTFTIIGTLKDVPGSTDITSVLGPRIYIPLRFLPETQLLGFGATAEFSAVVRLPAGADPAKFAAPLRRPLSAQQVRIRTVTQSERSATNATDTLSTFIGIVGLVALLLGGIGVASGVRAFVARKIDTVAILRCLGATSGQVLTVYVAQAAVMGLAGATAGAILGVALQFVLPNLVGHLLPVDVTIAIEPKAIVSGIAIGGWIALIFALRPLLALRSISPLQTLRRDADTDVLRMRWNDPPRLLVNIALVASVIIVALLRAGTVQQGLWLAAATGGVVLVLTGSAMLLAALMRTLFREGWPYVIRQGVANIYRPANQTRAVVLALGFGAFLLTTLYLVQYNVLRTLTLDARVTGANLLFFDVQGDQAAPIDSLIKARGFRVVQQAPAISMRIAALNGVPIAKLTADSTGPHRRERWTLSREYRSTFRDSLSGGERLRDGHWFDPTKVVGHNDTGEVSLDVGVADGLRVKLGDVITWNVQGVPITTRVTSFRTVTWTRFEPNFFAVFQPGVLRDAPKQYIILANVPGAANIANMQRETVRQFPNVSVIDLALITATIEGIVGKVSTAIRFMALFALAIGIPVLFSAVAATRRERIREGVLLKTLGATRAQIIRILVTEYALLGLLGSATGLVLAIGGGWALVHYVFKLQQFAPGLVPATLIAIGRTAVTILIGVLAGRDVFRETAMAALRETA
jgi:putative ABC transport system permease protein